MISLRSTAQDGTDACWLDQLGQVSGWKHTATFPGGPSSAGFTYSADPLLGHPALDSGRLLHAYQGSVLVWSGRLEQPVRGVPWQCTATGIAALAKDYAAFAPAGDIYDLDATVDHEISVGLPWTRNDTLTDPAGSALSWSDTLDGVLGQLVQQGGYWSLTPDGVVTTPDGPDAAPSLLLFATDLPPRTLDNYANVVVVIYDDSGASGARATVSVNGTDAEIAKYGRIYTRLDMTGLGNVSTAAATAAGTKVLARYGQGPAFTQPFTAGLGQLLTLGGTPIDPAVIRPGIRIRVVSLTPQVDGTGVADVPIGQIDYDDDTATVQLIPLVASLDDMESLLARAV